eukprot:COSAG01_NODE_16121_length_1268_cov_1.437981_1_plen_44_part_10
MHRDSRCLIVLVVLHICESGRGRITSNAWGQHLMCFGVQKASPY